MSKAKEGLVVADAIDLQKPLVKDYVDPDLALDNFLKLRLPHVPRATTQCKLVYRSKDGSRIHFRVNWWREDASEDSFVGKYSIVHSAFYEVKATRNGYELIEV
jgi:hypothetical protein